MVKKAFTIAIVAIAILIIVSIIIAVTNLKPATFKRVVSYDAGINEIVEAPEYIRSSGNEEGLFSILNLLKYERTIMITTVILVIIFALFFYGTKKSKGW